jgi:hypothetical protein
MKFHYAPRALIALESAPEGVRKAFYKQVRLLSTNLRHPSLRTKRFDDGKGWWQARVNDDWRFCGPHFRRYGLSKIHLRMLDKGACPNRCQPSQCGSRPEWKPQPWK